MTKIKQLTVGDLKKALEGIPDNVEVTVESDDCNPNLIPTMARYITRFNCPSFEIYGVSIDPLEEDDEDANEY